MNGAAKTVRNVAIIVALALAVWLIPGGAEAGQTISNILSVILFAGLAFFGYRLYMENRTTLFDLPESRRLILYGSAALVTITLIATGRMWDSGSAWILIWFALLGLAAYGFVVVIRAWREY